jgi:hypothetical protein
MRRGKTRTLGRMDADLEVLVVAPPEEVKKAGESTYVVLQRTIDLDVSPFIGLQVGLAPNLKESDTRLPRYEQLMHLVSNNTAIFEVEAVTFFTARKGASGRIVLRAKEIAENTSERFQAYIEFLTDFYGFDRST